MWRASRDLVADATACPCFTAVKILAHVMLKLIHYPDSCFLAFHEVKSPVFRHIRLKETEVYSDYRLMCRVNITILSRPTLTETVMGTCCVGQNVP